MKRLVVISAGTGTPSSTRQLADRIAQKSLDRLGDATVIDSIRVEWPSGMTSELRNVLPRQTLTITEGAALSLARVDNQTVDLTWSASDHILESSGNLSQLNWQPVLNVTGTRHRIITEQQQFFRLRRP